MTPFPLNLIPDPLGEYIESAARSMDCDPAYVAVPMLPVLASAIGNARRIRLKDGWTEPAVIWAAVVGESGTVKSPAMELATAPVWRRQKAILKEYAHARAQYEAELREWKATAKKERIGPGPEAPERCEHPICSDITIEALADRLEATPRGTLVALDELGAWFGSFNRYQSGGGDVPAWLTMHGARGLKIDRKTADRPTTFIRNSAVGVVGTIQPRTLQKMLLPEYFDCGLAARLLLAMPAPVAKRWSDHEIDPQLADQVHSLFDHLYALRPDIDRDGDPTPRLIEPTDEARGAWATFVNRWNEGMQDMPTGEKAAAAKLEGYAARFALVLHCVNQVADGPHDYVELAEIEAGIQLTEWFMSETQRVYLAMSETSEDRQRRELLEWIARRGGCVTVRDLMRNLRRYNHAGEQAEADLREIASKGLGEFRHEGRMAVPTFYLADSPDFPITSRGADADTIHKNNGKTAIASASAAPRRVPA